MTSVTKIDPKTIERYGLNPADLRPVEVVILGQLSGLGEDVDEIKSWMNQKKGADAAVERQISDAERRATARRNTWGLVAASIGSVGGLAGLGTFLVNLLRSGKGG